MLVGITFHLIRTEDVNHNNFTHASIEESGWRSYSRNTEECRLCLGLNTKADTFVDTVSFSLIRSINI